MVWPESERWLLFFDLLLLRLSYTLLAACACFLAASLGSQDKDEECPKQQQWRQDTNPGTLAALDTEGVHGGGCTADPREPHTMSGSMQCIRRDRSTMRCVGNRRPERVHAGGSTAGTMRGATESVCRPRNMATADA